MSCVLSKAPINIPKESKDLCVEKCSLKFNYGKSSLSIKNNGDYLSLGYDASTTNVKYNANKLYKHHVPSQKSLRMISGEPKDYQQYKSYKGSSSTYGF